MATTETSQTFVQTATRGGLRYLHREGVWGGREAAQISCTHLLNTTVAHTHTHRREDERVTGGEAKKNEERENNQNEKSNKHVMDKKKGETGRETDGEKPKGKWTHGSIEVHRADATTVLPL